MVSNRGLIKNIFLKLFWNSYLKASKYISVSFFYYIMKNLFIVIFSIKNNLFFLWYFVNYLTLLCLKQFQKY